MYNQDGQFEPTDGNDYKLMFTKNIEDLAEEIEEMEVEIELPKDIYGDEYDSIVTGEE